MASCKTIMIIDDDERYKSLLSEELQDEGYEIVHAGNGAEAIGILGHFKPDLIILDIMMPVMNGMEVLEPIKRLYEDVPIILHSFYNEFKRDLKSLRAAAYLPKSSDFIELKQTIRKLL